MIELNYENNIFTIEENGITLKVEPDIFPVNSRDYGYNTTMLLWNHPDFVGDENPYQTYEDFEKAFADTTQPINNTNCISTLIFFDTETNTISGNNTRNSYRLGVIYMPHETAINECGGIPSGYKQLYQEIENYNNFINGKFFSFTVSDKQNNLLHAGSNILYRDNALTTVKDMAVESDRDYYHLFQKLITDMEINPQQPRKKFTNCNVFAVLGEIVKHNVNHYQSDFGYDKADFQNAAYSPDSAETNFLWLARPNGTELTTEREAYVKDTRGHNTWVFFGEQTNDPIVAYAVEIKGTENGRVMGDLYELDYKEHYKRVKEKALPPHKVQLIYRHSNKIIDYEPHWTGKIQNQDLLRSVMLPADLKKWDEVLNAAQAERHNTHYEEWDFFYLHESYEKEKSEAEME